MKKIRTIIPFIVLLMIIFNPALINAKEDNPAVSFKYYSWKEKDTPEKIFDNYWVDVLRFNRIDRNHLYPGTKIKVPLNFSDVADYTPMPKFYQPAEIYEKYILISLNDQFLGCYEYGQLKYSFPVASGKPHHNTPLGDYKVLARHRDHHSSKYTITGTDIPYPMTWAVKFKISKSGTAFWIHGRDLPGYPASHGCVGLYDEEMQKKYYGQPDNPQLTDAKKLYLWLFPNAENDGNYQDIQNGAPVRIVQGLK